MTAPAPEVWTDLTAERDPTGDRQDLERSSTGDTSRQPPRPARSIPVTLVVGVGLLIVAAALVTLRQPSAGGTDQLAAAVTRPVGRATIVGAAASTTSSSLAPPTSKAAPTPSSNRVTVEFSGATYQVGEPGDRVAVADWDCDGAASTALVRPSTGEIFVFDGWPGTGEVTVTARARIARARELVGTPPGPECRSPRVRLDDGTLAALPTEAGD